MVWVLLDMYFRGCSIVMPIMSVSSVGNKPVAYMVVSVASSSDDGEEGGEKDLK